MKLKRVRASGTRYVLPFLDVLREPPCRALGTKGLDASGRRRLSAGVPGDRFHGLLLSSLVQFSLPLLPAKKPHLLSCSTISSSVTDRKTHMQSI